ncbi:periplasmic heavy metal sensor [Profundibacter sp.]
MGNNMGDVGNKVSAGRWVKVLLAVSLGLNMLVLGAVGARLYSNRGDALQPHNLRDASYGPYSRALSPQDRKAIGAALHREVGSLRENLPQIRETFQALILALQAEDYDRDAVHGLIAEQQAMGLKRQQVGQRLLLERLDSMTVEERRAFAKRLQRTLRHRRAP